MERRQLVKGILGSGILLTICGGVFEALYIHSNRDIKKKLQNSLVSLPENKKFRKKIETLVGVSVGDLLEDENVIGLIGNSQKLTEYLNNKIKDDFGDNRVLPVNNWILSETELKLILLSISDIQ